MANELTGDFDIVAEFAIPAVNRVLAAMHRIERFPHSLAVQVDDTPRNGPGADRASIMGLIDEYGDTIADHGSFGTTCAPDLSVGGTGASSFDAVVNIQGSLLTNDTIVPSHLKGRAQLQLAPPTLHVPDASDTKITVGMEVMSRYLPDPGTAALPEFMRGSISITAPVNQVASQVGNIIDIGIKSTNVVANYTSSWSSRPLSPEDLAGINLLIGNSLKTSFLPSNAKLPSQIAHMQFKTMAGQGTPIAVLLDMSGAAGNPASAHNVFLQGNDGFGFAVGAEYIKAAFQPTIDNILSKPVDPVKFDMDAYFHTWHITYTITLNSAALDLQAGKMVLVIKGHAHTNRSWLPDFDFTVTQAFTIVVSGATANLGLGTMSLDTSSWIVNQFKGGALESMRKVRDDSLEDSDAQATVRKMLSADENLGGFLRSLLSPAGTKPPLPPLNFTLAYTAAEIRPSGLILHGEVAVPAWPQPRVEFEQIAETPVQPGNVHVPDAMVHGPDYSALKSWIPGGTLRRFEWHKQGSSETDVDTNRFVLVRRGPVVAAAEMLSASAPSGLVMDSGMLNSAVSIHATPAYSPMCLTISGDRLSSSGAVVSQQVTAKMCGYGSFPFPGDFQIAEGDSAGLIALARAGAGGLVEVVGHAERRGDRSRRMAPNMVVHFAGDSSRVQLDSLTRAVRESGRTDAATAVIVVIKSSEMVKAKFVDGVTYAVDDGAWQKRLGIDGMGAVTALIAPNGKVVWRSEGPIDPGELASVLKKGLVAQDSIRVELLTANARIGHSPPNFLFEFSSGLEITLRKMNGRPVMIVFWRSSSQPSIDAVRAAASSAASANGSGPIVLAVNDGAGGTAAEKRPRETGSAIIVPDPDRRISSAYGIAMWPTTISIDESGLIRAISYGHTEGGK